MGQIEIVMILGGETLLLSPMYGANLQAGTKELNPLLLSPMYGANKIIQKKCLSERLLSPMYGANLLPQGFHH